MTHTAVHSATLTQEAQNVSIALGELVQATRRLMWALWKTLTQGQPPCPVKTARQQADKLRAYADTLYRADPRHAQDLYAAATRHELAASAD